jgi:hypothetical protein
MAERSEEYEGEGVQRDMTTQSSILIQRAKNAHLYKCRAGLQNPAGLYCNSFMIGYIIKVIKYLMSTIFNDYFVISSIIKHG